MNKLQHNPCVDCGKPDPQDDFFRCKNCGEIMWDMFERARRNFQTLLNGGVSRKHANVIILKHINNELPQ